MAPSQQIQSAAHHLRQQDGSHGRRFLQLRRESSRTPRCEGRSDSGADRRRSRLPGRGRSLHDEEDHLHRRCGFGDGDRREPHRRTARDGHAMASRTRRGDRRARRRAARNVLRGQRNPGRPPQDGSAQGDNRRRSAADAVRFGVQEQGHSTVARRRRRLSAVAARSESHHRQGSQRRQRHHAQGR